MPVSFLTQAQVQSYGRYHEAPTPEQLARFFHLNESDRVYVRERRSDHNRLGVALQLCTVRFLGTFLTPPTEVPDSVIVHLAQQLDILDCTCLRHYNKPQTWWDHAAEIRQRLGYQDFHEQPGHWRLVRWLYGRAWFGDESPSVLFDLTTAWLVERKLLLPGVTVLERLVARVREQATQRTWRILAQLPNSQQRASLEALLIQPEKSWYTPFDQLRRAPSRYSAPALVEALQRLVKIRALAVSQLNLARIPPSRLKALSRTAMSLKVQAIARMPLERRLATLLAFAHEIEANAQDDALDVLELVMKTLLAKSAREGKQERLRTLKDLDAAALCLSTACRVLLTPEPPPDVRKAVFDRVSQERLAQSVARVEALARRPDDQYYPEVLLRWRSVRLFLPLLLETIHFQATKAGHSLLTAIQFLQTLEGKPKPKMAGAPLGLVKKGWQHWVILAKDEVDRRAYTFCILEQLMEGLRRRDLFVTPSVRWSNPHSKLLQGDTWEAARTQICRTLNLEPLPKLELERLGEQLNEAYQRTAKNLPTNPAVSIEMNNGRETLTISNLDKLEETASLLLLKEQVASLLPRADLPEVLLEIHAKTGFLNEFTHVGEEDSHATDLPISLCAVLVAAACNIGLRPLQRQDVLTLTRHRLLWVQQSYIRPETLIVANAWLVKAQSHIPLAQTWGGGEVASADGLRFVVPVRTINAGPNRKYFGKGRGITYYNFTSDQFTGFHGLVVPGTLRDSLVVLMGLLEQRTSLRPKELMTDTSGYSDIIFGLFWLLGYQFSPRLADTGEARFWRLDQEAEYGALNGLARQRVKSRLIEDQWDDMLRVAGSLKVGTVSALEIMRVLQRLGKPSTLGSAIGELGRVAKTLYLLNYVDDEAYRRRILLQLNREEGRHSLARAVCHGQKGEIRQRYREGQENQLGILGLVVNALVLWNTLYMDAALDCLREQGYEVKPEDVARLSPLGYRHINMLGRYHFSLPEFLQHGGMRPLRNPKNPNDFED